MTDKIRTYIKALADEIGITIVRAEQSGERPAYPFLSYKILSGTPEPAQGIIVNREKISGNDIQVTEISMRETEAVVSLSLIAGEKKFHDLWGMALDAYDWVDSAEGTEKAAEAGIGVTPVSAVQDRTVYFETEYEHKLGFDIKVTNKRSRTETVDVVDIAATIEDFAEVSNN